MNEFLVILKSVSVLSLLMGIGFFATKTGYISKDVKNTLSKIVVRLTLPFSIINSLTNIELDKEKFQNMIFVLLASFVIIFVLWILSGVIAKAFKMDDKKALAHKVMTSFGNISFLGYPLIYSLWGDIGLFYAAIYAFANDILVWTFVISKFAISGGAKPDFKTSLKHSANPPTLSFLLSLVMLLFGLKLPPIVSDASAYLAGATVPLSMLFIGAKLSEVDFRGLFKSYHTLFVVLIKMLIIPVISIFVMRYLPFDPLVKGVIIMQSSVPSQTIISVISAEYKGDTDYVIKCIFTTTVLGLVSLPFVYYLITIIFK